MIGNIEKKICTGCKMCEDICPKLAITFECDEQGFWYPKVDKQKCIECGLCDKRCPSLNIDIITNNKMPEVYSAWSKDDNVRTTSTSGGAFWVIAKSFMDNGGLVAGSRYTKDWKGAQHIIARNIDDLLEVKGSKYFQSDTSTIYSQVKKELDNGRKVLFCGTPCQNAAIKSFLGREYENLFCMDFICRSINSPKAFKAYIDELEQKQGSNVSEVHLKNKKYGWQSLASQVKFKNGEEIINDKNTDWWVRGFIYNDLYTRESCYNCQYKKLPRVSADLTIGDFWGIKNQTEEDMFKGISVIMVNSEKGRTILDECRDGFVLKKHTIDDVKPGNPALLKNPVRTKKQDMFFELLKNHSFSYCVEKCIKRSIFSKINTKCKAVGKKGKKAIKLVLNPRISTWNFIYYNFLCKNIVRSKAVWVIPYKGAILDLHPTSRIYLKGRNLEICTNKLKGSKAECHIRMEKDSRWDCTNGAYLFYNTVLEIKPSATLETGFFSANGGSVIIAHKKIVFGDDVMIGRNVIIYDSDFHTLYNGQGIACNPPIPVVVEDHVWLTSNIIVQKGVTIGRDSLITAYTTVNKNVPQHSIFGGNSVGKQIKDDVSWGRDTCPLE